MIAAVYIRKSREDKNKPAHRLTVQREQLPAHARAQGWQVQVYDDGHASAAKGKTEDLRERARLEADVRAGRINIIFIIELSRLSRDDSLVDFSKWIDLCRQHNVRLATLSQIYDPSDVSQWTFLSMGGVLSSAEMQRWKERVDEGRAEAFRSGAWLGGKLPPPYLYDRASGEVLVDEEKLSECKRIWQMVETHSAKAIAEHLGKAEITIRRMISDKRLLFYQALRLDSATGEPIEGQWPAVMDAEQADRIRASRRTRKTNGVKREAAGLLSNLDLLRCGYCGLTVKTWRNSRSRNDGSRLDYYGCRSKNSGGSCDKSRMVPQAALNERLLTNLFGTLDNIEAIKTHWQAAQQNDTTAEQIARLDAEEQHEQQRKQNLVAAIADGILRPEDARAKMADIETALGAIRQRRRQIEASRPEQPDWQALAIPRDEFDTLSETEQRPILRAAINEVRLFNASALITYTFPRTGQGDRTARIHLPAAQKGWKTRTKGT